MDKIILKNMRFFAYHGVLPEEQKNGQEFFIDVEMHTDVKDAGTSDDLHDTIDYSAVYRIVKDITQNNKFKLIEKLACSISGEILSRFGKINRIVVNIRKPQAPIGGELDYAEVEIVRDRHEL